VFLGSCRGSASLCWPALFFIAALPAKSAIASDFRFNRDTFAFANETVFEYRDGLAHLRKPSATKNRPLSYTRRCFVMSRAAMQFRKFARFDPHGAPLDDRTLAERVRAITRRPAWEEALPADRRIVVPGYTNLRAMSRKRSRVLQDNIGIGWTTYLRFGNIRIFFEHTREHQERTHADLDATLARGELFVAYLSTFPNLSINHAVLVYARERASPSAGTAAIERYVVYDPNHPEAPRELTWSPTDRAFAFQKDWDFVGGFVRAYQVYGKPIQ
jgi:hypothetical protein